MAATYDYLPYDISVIFRSIVSTVNDNLTTDTSLSIPRVMFKAETWMELCNRLKADNDSEDHKSIKYPLIALIRNYESDIKDDSPYIDSTFAFVIVTQTEPTRLSEDRLSINYRPILYPIYTEFLEQIALSPYFYGPYDPYPTHKMIESFNLGKEGVNGNGALQLPEYVDAIVITGMKLKVNRPMVAGFNYGPTKTLTYLNNVSKLTITTSGHNLTITLNEATNTDASHVAVPVYTVNFPGTGDGSLVITVGGSQTYTIGSDGDYTGYISCNDGITESKLFFFYCVSNGAVIKYSTMNQFKLQNFLTGGFDYPFDTFDILTQTTANKSLIAYRDTTYDGGNVINEETYTPSTIDTTATTYTEVLAITTAAHRDIGCDVNIDGSRNTTLQLNSISYYKLS